jgi:protein SCO1/2
MMLKIISGVKKKSSNCPPDILSSRRRLLLAGLSGAMLLAGCGTESMDGMQMQGTMSAQPSTTAVSQADLGDVPAPDLQLQDQNGKAVSLSELKGKVVALTFWYTHCPDMCPLAAEKFRQVLSGLDKKKVEQIAVLAVSVDPANDTANSAQQFSQAHRLAPYANWHFLLGTQKQLQPVWKDYHIYTDAEKATSAQGQALNHMAIVYLIDQQGRERVMLPADFTPSQLRTNLESLLVG